MLDFNNEQAQQIRAQGPIPAGSSVLVHLHIRKPKYEVQGMDFVAQAKSGMLYLDAEYEVIAGQYAGFKLWENLFLPRGHQQANLSQGQEQACSIAGAKMRAMLEAAKGVDPKDESPQAARKRQISSWLDFSGLEFPIVVGIAKEQNEGKDGKMYWNNSISRIVTPNMPQYEEVRHGGEIITNGPITGDGGKRGSRHSNNGGDPGYDQPPASAYDSDVPF